MPSALVAEDNNAVAYLHEVLLQRYGFTTTRVRNGREAIDLVSSGNKFDVILMNKHMPVMNGVKATMILRSMNVKSLIVGVTAGDDVEDFRAAGLDEGFLLPLNSAKVSKVFHLLSNFSPIDR